MWKRDSKVICVLKINIDDSAQESGQEWESEISMQAIEDEIVSTKANDHTWYAAMGKEELSRRSLIISK